MKSRVLIVLVLGLLTLPAAAEELRERALKTLDQSLSAMKNFQRHGGWGVAWSLDEKVVWGEWLPIPEDWITVQAPATPSTGGTYLRAGQVLEDARWIGVAREAHDALVRLQSPDGGLPHEGPPVAGETKRGSFDDGTTTNTLAFFIDVWKHTGATEDRAAVDRIGNFMLTSQYADSGGWPQSYPPPNNYGRYITFNDGNFSNIVHALFTLERVTGDPRYREAALRGGECILILQGGAEESIWAQQYEPESMEPAWARKFEPPGYSPAESTGVCETLVELFVETGDMRYVESLGRALAWYEDHKLENGKYARLYEPGTQRPVYGRRDKAEKVYDFANACEGYGWQGTWYPNGAKKAFDAIEAEGAEAFRAAQKDRAASRSGRPDDATVTRICDALTEAGHWIRTPDSGQREVYGKHGVAPETPMILLRDFNVHVNQLLDFVVATR